MATQASAPSAGSLPVEVIQPSAGRVGFRLGELWRHRELLLFLTWRNVLVRYKQAALGVAWAVLQPLFLMLVFSLFFGRLTKMPSDGVPYPLFAFTGLLVWLLFANSVTQASSSLVANANLLTKIYFPRMALPLAAVLASVVDFCVALVVLIGFMLWYAVHPDPLAVLVAPAVVLLAVVTALGVGLWLSALNVKYRDVQYVIPFLIQLWLFATPVVYPASLAPENLRFLFGLNPMAGVVEGWRAVMLGTNAETGPLIAVSVAVSLAILVSGAYYFRRAERTFADVV